MTERNAEGAATGDRPIALVTGASRRSGLGAAIAAELARSGWDVAITYWSAYDRAMEWGPDTDGPAAIQSQIGRLGGTSVGVEADLADPSEPARILDTVEASLGRASGLVLNHCECRPAGLMDTDTESLRSHFAVNVVANALLVQEFARRFPAGAPGRIVSLTSDHTVGNVGYGTTKAAADRLTLAAAYELAHLGITANVVNPGPTDTGWMTEQHRAEAAGKTPLPRWGVPQDAANLVGFLFSGAGGWVTGQLIHRNGGFRSNIG